MCCFRFKLWWMTQRMGSSGSEVPYETQFMLLEGPSSDMYTVLLPIIEGPFRASLQGSDNNELALCLESGKLLSCFSFFLSIQLFSLHNTSSTAHLFLTCLFLFLQEIQMCRHCIYCMPCTSMQAVTHSKSSQMLCGGSPHHSIPQFRAWTLLVQIARVG